MYVGKVEREAAFTRLPSSSDLAWQPLSIMLLPPPIPETRDAVAIYNRSELCTSSMDTKAGTRVGHGGTAHETDHCYAREIVCRALAMRCLTAVKGGRTVMNTSKAESVRRHEGQISVQSPVIPGQYRSITHGSEVHIDSTILLAFM